MTVDTTDEEREQMTFGELLWATFDRSAIVRNRAVLEIGRRLIASLDAEEWEHSVPALAVMRFREEWDPSQAVGESASDTLFLWKHA
jgi:hypothetical protein